MSGLQHTKPPVTPQLASLSVQFTLWANFRHKQHSLPPQPIKDFCSHAPLMAFKAQSLVILSALNNPHNLFLHCLSLSTVNYQQAHAQSSQFRLWQQNPDVCSPQKRVAHLSKLPIQRHSKQPSEWRWRWVFLAMSNTLTSLEHMPEFPQKRSWIGLFRRSRA